MGLILHGSVLILLLLVLTMKTKTHYFFPSEVTSSFRVSPMSRALVSALGKGINHSSAFVPLLTFGS